MEHILNQKDIFLNRKSFRITSKGLHVTQKGAFKSNEFFLGFESIGVKPIISHSIQKGWIAASIVFLLLSITLYISEISGGDVEKNAYAFYFTLFLICALFTFLTYKKSFYIANNDNKNAIEFLTNKPSKLDLENFISKLKQERKEYLINVYGQIDKRISYEQQYNNITWLIENDVLTKAEFEKKTNELNRLFAAPTQISGFKFGII